MLEVVGKEDGLFEEKEGCVCVCFSAEGERNGRWDMSNGYVCIVC